MSKELHDAIQVLDDLYDAVQVIARMATDTGGRVEIEDFIAELGLSDDEIAAAI